MGLMSALARGGGVILSFVCAFFPSFFHSLVAQNTMSATRGRRLKGFKDFTHYLSIPLATRTSRPQLHASFAPFAETSSAIVPEGAICNPDCLKLDLGRLKLKSPRDFEACSKLLHGFDIPKILQVAAITAASSQLTPPQQLTSPAGSHRLHDKNGAMAIDVSPLKIDISGLFSMDEDISRAKILYALAIDRSHRFQHFQRIILDSLSSAGFLANRFSGDITIVRTAMPFSWGNMGFFDPKLRRWNHSGRPRAPQIDARGLIESYRDYEWAKNIQLETLGIYGLGARVSLANGGARERQMEEIEGIALA